MIRPPTPHPPEVCDDCRQLIDMGVCSKPSQEEGRKDDSGKLRYDLLPWKSLREVVGVLTFGAIKYAPDNWRHVPDAKARYTSAFFRHVEAWRGGETHDPETGLHHLAHAICCLLFLLELDHGK